MRGDVKNSVGTVMRVTLGLMTCLAISFGLLTLISALTVSGKIGESQTAKLIPIVWGLSGLFGTLIGKKDRETNKWLSAYVLGGYAGVLFTCGMLAFEGALHRPWLPLICIFIGYLLSGELKKGASKKEKDIVRLVKITKNTQWGKFNLPYGGKMQEKLQRLYLVRNLKTAPPYLEISIIIHDFCDV